MTPDVAAALKLAIAAVVMLGGGVGAGIAFGKWLFGRGGRETATDLALARLNAIADKFERKLADDQMNAIAAARKEGERAAWERTIQARVEEMDETLEEMSRARYSSTSTLRSGGNR